MAACFLWSGFLQRKERRNKSGRKSQGGSEGSSLEVLNKKRMWRNKGRNKRCKTLTESASPTESHSLLQEGDGKLKHVPHWKREGWMESVLGTVVHLMWTKYHDHFSDWKELSIRTYIVVTEAAMITHEILSCKVSTWTMWLLTTQ